jgi:hypothetical protein
VIPTVVPVPTDAILGKPLDLEVTATDPSGTTKTATIQIQVAPTLVNP